MDESVAPPTKRWGRRTVGLGALFSTLFIGAALCTWLLITTVDEADESSVGPVPQVLLLTDQDRVSASYVIRFEKGSFTGPFGTTFTGPPKDLPVGVRVMQVTFRTEVPSSQIRWAILLNDDASLTEATAARGLGELAVSLPGTVLASSCPQAQAFQTRQVISGTVTADQDGRAEFDVHGGIADGVKYRPSGARTAVNVIQVLSPAPPASASSSGGCDVNLINWEQVGGLRWKTPTVTSGNVTVGGLGVDKVVESANPPLTNAGTLSWELQGPNSVTYTLLDSSDLRRRELYLLLAGATAGLAAASLIELLKVLIGTNQRSTQGQQGSIAVRQVPVGEMPRLPSVTPASARVGRGPRIGTSHRKLLAALTVGAAMGAWLARVARTLRGRPRD